MLWGTAYAREVIRAATAYLAAHGVDVVITNTSRGTGLRDSNVQAS